MGLLRNNKQITTKLRTCMTGLTVLYPLPVGCFVAFVASSPCHSMQNIESTDHMMSNIWWKKFIKFRGYQLIEAERRIYAPVIWTIIGSDNGLFGIKPLPEPMMNCYELYSWQHRLLILKIIKPCYSRKRISTWRLENGGHFVSGSMCISSLSVAWCNQGEW